MFPQTRRQHFRFCFSCHKERFAPCGSIYIIITFMITPYVPKMYNHQTIFCIVFCIASILYTFHWENWVKPPNSFSFSNNSHNKIYTRQIFYFRFYWISNYYCHAIQFVLFFTNRIKLYWNTKVSSNKSMNFKTGDIYIRCLSNFLWSI